MDDVAKIEELIRQHQKQLLQPGVLSVRPGWQVTDGWLTGRRAIVASVTHKGPVRPGEALPAEIDGVPVDVRQASDRKQAALRDGAAAAAVLDLPPDRGGLPATALASTVPARTVSTPAAAVRAAEPSLPYTAPAGVALTPVTGTVVVQTAVSPDAGWGQLQEFLTATSQSLTVGLYDFTSAHVLTAVEHAASGKQLRLVLDHPARNPTADQSDDDTVHDLAMSLGNGFQQAWALVRGDSHATAAIYPSAYHIKVAVRDHTTVWLSSGNWNNSNQPDIDPVHVPADRAEARGRDRDWHVVIDSADLAAQFEAYLNHDYDIAAAHNTAVEPAAAASEEWVAVPAAQTPPPVQWFSPLRTSGQTTITPLLTPDPGVYTTAVLALIESAQTSLLLQFQYIELPRTAAADNQPFRDLVAAIVARQTAGVDVRVITSEFETADYLEELQTAGLDVVHRVRVQNNVHNKGIVADRTRVLVSSQNWSTAGTLHNRDAGVIIDNPNLADYYAAVFEHDWAHLATAQSTDS